MRALSFRVSGKPAPQGSKRHVGNGRMLEMSPNLRPWRDSVAWHTRQAAIECTGGEPLAGPVSLALTFWLARPKSHYRTGRFAHLLRDDAPAIPETSADLDKLARAVADAITAGKGWADDSQVAVLHVSRLFGEPGCHITISELTTPEERKP